MCLLVNILCNLYWGCMIGWVFERHPDLGIAMLEYLPGTIIDTVDFELSGRYVHVPDINFRCYTCTAPQLYI